MDLVCPNCQKPVSIEDRQSGMLVKCPLCEGMLQTPVIPTLPARRTCDRPGRFAHPPGGQPGRPARRDATRVELFPLVAPAAIR